MGYVDGFVIPVPKDKLGEYRKIARKAGKVWMEHGALAYTECWEADVPEGKLTSFPMAIKRAPGEAVVFSWVIWPDKAAADRCFASVESDTRWNDLPMPFDGKRMIHGGFEPIFTAGNV